MNREALYNKSVSYLKTLCREIPERCTGSEGNRTATAFFEKEISLSGWKTEVSELGVVDWDAGGASLYCGGKNYDVLVSPYSNGCEAETLLTCASTVEELEKQEITGTILLLYGSIAGEQLMPKNFVFYNPEEHQRIIALLEEKRPAAVVSATGRNAALAGGVYPFPLIEGGNFDIPSVYMTEEEGEKLKSCIGSTVTLNSLSRRIPEKAYNVTAVKGKNEN